MLDSSLDSHVVNAAKVISAGGVIAYPTEYCFGLGCDPRYTSAVQKLLSIKQRKAEQGVILIAADLDQVRCYADLNEIALLDQVLASWPGPNTWLLPCLPNVSEMIRGKHETIAMRIPNNEFCLRLLGHYGHPIVSTSANRSGQKEHLSAATLRNDLGVECDYIVDYPVGGATQASTIRHASTGHTLR